MVGISSTLRPQFCLFQCTKSAGQHVRMIEHTPSTLISQSDECPQKAHLPVAVNQLELTTTELQNVGCRSFQTIRSLSAGPFDVK